MEVLQKSSIQIFKIHSIQKYAIGLTLTEYKELTAGTCRIRSGSLKFDRKAESLVGDRRLQNSSFFLHSPGDWPLFTSSESQCLESHMMTSSYGLKWEDELMGLRPCWTVDPSIDIIAEIAQTVVNFQFEGAFNKLYAIECPSGSFFMRISLPVDPHFKTASEVATVKLLESKTSIPVPQIIASNSSANNELKFEWILMKRVPGLPLAEVWGSLGWEAKLSCVNAVAVIMAQLFELKYKSIGNLFNEKDLSPLSECPSEDDAVESNAFILDRIVSMIFFWGAHLAVDVSRGPFPSSKDWINARFQLMEADCRRVLNAQDVDEDDMEDMENAQQLLERLRRQLDSFFPSLEREEFALQHDDISRHNLIVDSKGELQALVDWECVSVMPLWKTCQIPSFIDTLKRTQRPNSEDYMKNADGSINSLYHEHLDEYECTCLRDHFLKEMKRIAPQWILEYQNSAPKMNFDRALQNCDGGIWTKRVRKWLDDREVGAEHRRLEEF